MVRGNRRLTVTSAALTGLNALWGLLAATQTAIAAPETANSVWRFFVNTPDAIPWIFAAVALAVFAWSLFPRKEEPEPESVPSQSARTTGDHSPATAIGTARDVYIGHPPPAATQPRKSPYGSGSPPSRGGGTKRAIENMLERQAQRCPETPIWKAVQHVARVLNDTDESQCYTVARHAIRQAALEGQIVVWGQKDIPPAHMTDERHSTVWTKISPEYWEEYELSPMATAEIYPDRDHTWEEALKSRRGNRYWNLKVDKAEIDAVSWLSSSQLDAGLERVIESVLLAPRPDLPLNALLGRVYKKLGRAPKESAQLAYFRKRVDREIANEVKLNAMHVWGHVGRQPIKRISQRDWSDGEFSHVNGQFTVTRGYPEPTATIYADLRFNRAEVDRVWPASLETTNDGKS